VKWFDSQRGFGFILQEHGPDVFVHYGSIIGHGFKTLKEGWMVNFVLIQSEKGLQAQQVVVLSHETAQAA